MFTVDDLYKKNNIAKVTRCLEEIDKLVREPKLENYFSASNFKKSLEHFFLKVGQNNFRNKIP